VQETSTANNLAWIVQDLVASVPDMRHAVLASDDGLPMARSAALSPDDADVLAAVVAGLLSLARGAALRFGSGPPKRVLVEMPGAHLFVAGAGDGTCLASVTTESAELGVIAYEVVKRVAAVQRILSAAPRERPAKL